MIDYTTGLRGTVAAFCVCLALATCCGCVGPAQKRTVRKWYDAYHCVIHGQESGRKPFPAHEIVAKIGQPDYIVKGSALATVIPRKELRETIIKLSAHNYAMKTVGQEPPESATTLVQKADVWFYDEASRYDAPSQPDSFWGMGTGYQIVWFIIDEKHRVITTGSLGTSAPIAPAYRKSR